MKTELHTVQDVINSKVGQQELRSRQQVTEPQLLTSSSSFHHCVLGGVNMSNAASLKGCKRWPSAAAPTDPSPGKDDGGENVSRAE